MKRIWARIGMTFELPDDVYDKLGANGAEGNEIELDEDWVEENIKYAKVDGDCYIPESCWNE